MVAAIAICGNFLRLRLSNLDVRPQVVAYELRARFWFVIMMHVGKVEIITNTQYMNIDFSVTNYSECVENLFNRKTYLSPNANLYLVVSFNIWIV